MDTEFQEVLCDEHGIGGDGEYCGDNGFFVCMCLILTSSSETTGGPTLLSSLLPGPSSKLGS